MDPKRLTLIALDTHVRLWLVEDVEAACPLVEDAEEDAVQDHLAQSGCAGQ
jgi:hypothetical protein